MATLWELSTIYTVSQVYDMLEILDAQECLLEDEENKLAHDKKVLQEQQSQKR